MSQLCKYQDGKTTVLANLPNSVRGLDFSQSLSGVLISDADQILYASMSGGEAREWFPKGSVKNPNAICVVGQQIYIEDPEELILVGDLSTKTVRPLLGRRSQQILHTIRRNGKSEIDRCGGLCQWGLQGVLLADSERNRVLTIGRDSLVSSFIGNGKVGLSISSVPQSCLVNRPCGIVCDNSKIYLSDTGNQIIRILTLSGAPIAVVGLPKAAVSTDPKSFRLQQPGDIALLNGSLFIADNRRLVRYDLKYQTFEVVDQRAERIQAITAGADSIFFIEASNV